MKAAVPLLVFVAACQPAGPDLRGFAAARAFGEDVVAAGVLRSVQELAAGHATDVHVSCDGIAPRDGLPACDLSRDAAIEHVTAAFEAMGYAPHTIVQGKDPEARNVVAERAGDGRAHEVVLVGAHLDAYFQGADDNCSGVAALLEVARLASGRSFRRTLRFVAFDLEDFGSLGSTRYVEAGLADDVIAAIVLDAVGYASYEPNSQDTIPGLPFGDVGDFAALIANGDSLGIAQRMAALAHESGFVEVEAMVAGSSGAFPLTGNLMRSDHGPFWLRGIPAVLVTDTANFRNPNYHEPTDTPETLDQDFLTGVTRWVAASSALLAEVDP